MMEDMQPRWIFTLNTKGKTEEDIMNGMDPKTRQILRKNERMGVKVRELESDELNLFHSVMEDTSSRREFANRPMSYYQKMYDAFKKKDEVMVLAAEFNHDNYIKELKEELVTERKYIAGLKADNKENTNKEKLEKKIKQAEENIKRFENNMRRYNFYGITGNFNEKENPFYGLYSFKRDFGGQVVELVGEFDLIISPFWFKVYNVAFKLYHKIKK